MDPFPKICVKRRRMGCEEQDVVLSLSLSLLLVFVFFFVLGLWRGGGRGLWRGGCSVVFVFAFCLCLWVFSLRLSFSLSCEEEVEGVCEEEDAVLYSAAPPARAIRPYGAGPSSLLIIDWEKNPAHPCPLPSPPGPWGQHHLAILMPSAGNLWQHLSWPEFERQESMIWKKMRKARRKCAKIWRAG